MHQELFRLNDEEASLVQNFRTLTPDLRLSILRLAASLSADIAPQGDNVVPFARLTRAQE